MKLCLLTEEQEKKHFRDIHEYTSRDIAELAGLSFAALSICEVMDIYCKYHRNSSAENESLQGPIFKILKMIIEPIDFFLSEGAPMRKGGTETAAAESERRRHYENRNNIHPAKKLHRAATDY